MDVSVIILNYNTFKITSNCIRSIYKFTSGIEFEVILVDNGSVECNPVLFKEEFPNIILVSSEENLGFSKGNNLGIKYAKGKHVLLLNSDTLLVENSILKCVDKLETLPADVAVITCKLIYPDGKIQHQCNPFPSITNEFIQLTRIHKLLSAKRRAKLFLSSFFNHKTDIYSDWVWGTFFLFKKQFLSDLPGNRLNDKYFMYCEDMKWCYDFKKAGKRIYYFAGTKLIHIGGQSYLDKSFRGENIARNEYDFTVSTRGRLYIIIYRIVYSLNVFFSSSIFFHKVNLKK